MQVKILSKEQVASLGVSMREIGDALVEGWQILANDTVELPAKIGIHPRKDCYIHAMPCYAKKIDAALIKWAAGYPSNFDKKLPFINGIIVVNNPETGLVEIIMDSAWVTAWRTGAAAGVCAEYMSEGAEIAAVVGTGVQGITSAIAFCDRIPSLKEIRIYDVAPIQLDRFEKEAGPYAGKIKITRCATVEECVTGADIVASSIPTVEKPNPIIKKQWLKPDVLAISSDYDAAYFADVMTGGTFVCDDRNQYLMTQSWGTYFQQYPKEAQVYADMAEICAGKKQPVKKGLRGAVLMGIAMHDIMTVRLIQEKLKTREIGQNVEI